MLDEKTKFMITNDASITTMLGLLFAMTMESLLYENKASPKTGKTMEQINSDGDAFILEFLAYSNSGNFYPKVNTWLEI